MKNFVYHNPTKIIFGKGQAEKIGEEAAAAGKKALLVTGRGSAEKSGLVDMIKGKLAAAGVEFEQLRGIVPNPEIDSVREGAAIARSAGTDMILAAGGGSVVDAAKAIAAAADYEGDPWDFFEKTGRARNPLPVGIVLTLSASGSEMNGACVISNPAAREKRPMFHPGLHPRFSILDPRLTFTVPADQTAYGAVDILSHVFEQYFHNTPSTSLQDGIAEAIMRTVIENAPIAMRSPSDYGARASLMWASSLALNGLVGAGTGGGDWASHMIEHELSAKYGMAHGAGLAVVFPAWMRHVYMANMKKFARFAVNVWGVRPDGKSDEQLAIAGIDAARDYFKNTLGVGVTLADYGIGGERIEEMAESAMRLKQIGSLVPLAKSDIVEIYKNALS